MKFIRDRVLGGELMFGIGANLGSSLTVEMIGKSGFDWTWIDCEHGTGDYSELIVQVQAASINDAPPIVRIAWNETPRFKRVLDLGAVGVMVPFVNTAEEAKHAAQAMRYPPEGVRGVAKFNRACGCKYSFLPRRYILCFSYCLPQHLSLCCECAGIISKGDDHQTAFLAI